MAAGHSLSYGKDEINERSILIYPDSGPFTHSHCPGLVDFSRCEEARGEILLAMGPLWHPKCAQQPTDLFNSH